MLDFTDGMRGSGRVGDDSLDGILDSLGGSPAVAAARLPVFEAGPRYSPSKGGMMSSIENLLNPVCFTVTANTALICAASNIVNIAGYGAGQGAATVAAAVCMSAGLAAANYKAILPVASRLRKHALDRRRGDAPEGLVGRMKHYAKSAFFALGLAASMWCAKGVVAGTRLQEMDTLAEIATVEKPMMSHVVPDPILVNSRDERHTELVAMNSSASSLSREPDVIESSFSRIVSESSFPRPVMDFVPQRARGRYSLGDSVEISAESMSYAGVASYGNPFQRALLDTISFAEKMHYDTLYGHGSFDDFSKHPDVSRTDREGRFRSDAAGRYGFMGSTYDLMRSNGFFQTGFHPVEQDRAALRLAESVGVNSAMIKKALITGNFGPIAYRLARTWPSLPADETGRNAYCEEGTDADTTECRRQTPNSIGTLAKMLRASYYHQLLKNPSPCGTNVSAVGDSFTAGGGYVGRLEDLCGVGITNSDDDKGTSPLVEKRRRGLRCDLFACEGKSAGQMAESFSDAMDSGPFDTVVILGGINDIAGGASADSVKADLAKMYTSARGMGVRVVAVALPPAGNSYGWTPEKQEVLEEVNSWILTQSTADVKVDAYSALEDPEYSGFMLKEFAGRGPHMNEKGKARLAGMVYEAMTRGSRRENDRPESNPYDSSLFAENASQK